jgi:hypothetical protein
MNVMAEAAGKTGMLALNLLQLNNLVGMAGKTLFCDVIRKLDNLGCMRVSMAPQTVVQFVMSLIGMTLTADRDNLFY